MPPADRAQGSPEDWLKRALSHLALATSPKLSDVFWEDLAFHCQQAAELSIKGIYQHRGIAFAYTHDIEDLLFTLFSQGLLIPAPIREAVILTKYASKARYPGLLRAMTGEDYQRALKLAGEVLSRARTVVGHS